MSGTENVNFRRMAIRRKSSPSLHSSALVFATPVAPQRRPEWRREASREAAGTTHGVSPPAAASAAFLPLPFPPCSFSAAHASPFCNSGSEGKVKSRKGAKKGARPLRVTWSGGGG